MRSSVPYSIRRNGRLKPCLRVLRRARNRRAWARGTEADIEAMDARVVTPRRLIVAVSGASGATYAVGLLQALREAGGIESHLVVSDAGWRNIELETGMDRASVEALAHR